MVSATISRWLLRADPSRLRIMGDGNQSKPYIHVSDVIAAILMLQSQQTEGYNFYNVATDDHLLVRDIADIVIREMGLKNVLLRIQRRRTRLEGRRSDL